MPLYHESELMSQPVVLPEVRVALQGWRPKIIAIPQSFLGTWQVLLLFFLFPISSLSCECWTSFPVFITFLSVFFFCVKGGGQSGEVQRFFMIGRMAANC